MKVTSLIPTCVGQWERGDTSCDGDNDSPEPSDREPCAWRSKCYGFQLRMRKKREKPAVYLTVVKLSPRMAELSGFTETAKPLTGTVTAFKRMCRHGLDSHASVRQLSRFRLSKVEATNNEDGDHYVNHSARTRAEKKAEERERVLEFRSIHRFVQTTVSEVFYDRLVLIRKGRLVMPGMLRFETLPGQKLEGRLLHRERYGEDRVLLTYKYLPSCRKVKVGVCVTTRQFSAVTNRSEFDVLNPAPALGANIRTEVSRAGRAELVVIIKKLRDLADKGVIKLWAR